MMSSVTPTADSNELSAHNDAVMEQVPSLNQPRPKQGNLPATGSFMSCHVIIQHRIKLLSFVPEISCLNLFS